MQLSEMRYITGLIMQGGGKIAGYSLAEPTCEIKKPDLVMLADIKSYLTKHNCKIINAAVDASGQVTFRSKADQESYVTMNASGYILGWPKRPLPKLHEGNKTGGKTGEMLRPTHSYIVVDINESENVVKVMNIGGMVKPMTLSKLKSAIAEGLIVSNVEVTNGNIKLLSQGMDELTIGKTVSTPISSIPPVTMSKPVPTTTVQPVKSTSTPLKPPTFVPGKELQKPVMPPVITPPATEKPTTPKIVSKPVIPPVVLPTVHAKSAIPPIPTVQPKVEKPVSNQPTVQPKVEQPTSIQPTQTHILDFKQLVSSGYSFADDFLTDYAGTNVKLKLDLYDFAPDQFNFAETDGKRYLKYTTDGSGTDKLQYFDDIDFGEALHDFLYLFNNVENRRKLAGVKLDLFYHDKRIDGFDYRMLYYEQGFLNFGYLVDWSKIDLFHLESEDNLTPTELTNELTLLLIPNKILTLGIKTAIADTNKLYGRFRMYNDDIWTDFLLGYRRSGRRKEDLRIIIHPRARISEMTPDALRVYTDYPFGHDEEMTNISIDLTNSSLRFIAKDAIRVQHGALYNFYLPDSCKRIHDGAVITDSCKTPTFSRRLNEIDEARQIIHYSHKESCNVTMANTIIFHGRCIERIDKVGNPFAQKPYYPDRQFIRCADWTTITNITGAVIAIEDLPEIKKDIDVTPYVSKTTDKIISDWSGIGTWSDTDKGKISFHMTHRPAIDKYSYNVYVDGTVKKLKLELVSEREDYEYSWPVIDYLFVAEGVTELEIIANTLRYTTNNSGKKTIRHGSFRPHINHLILPTTMSRLELKLTATAHSRYVRELDIPDNSILSKLDLVKQLNRYQVHPDEIFKYANEKIMHDKNMLSDMIGSDMNAVQMVSFDNQSIKENLALCGIYL